MSNPSWLGDVEDALVLANHRAHAVRNTVQVASVLHQRADEAGLSRPTGAVLAKETGVNPSTVGRCLRRLRDHGFLVLEQTGGWTPVDAHSAAVYRLTTPPRSAYNAA